MKISINKQIGNTGYSFEVENDEPKLAFQEAIKLDSQLPSTCAACKSQNLRFFQNEDEEKNIYIKLTCLDCKASRKMGKNKVGSGWFFRAWVKWNPDTKLEEPVFKTEETTPAPKEEEKEGNDLPF